MKDLKIIKIKTQKPYKVYIKDGIIGTLAPYVKEHLTGKKVLVVTDDVVSELYLDGVISQINKMGKTSYSFAIKNGESSKNFESYTKVIDYLAENEFTRKDCVVALGGGVVGDLSGFIASTYLRGISFIQIPTTLLSATDSSVGGKTGIDITKGKNLVGAFYSPKAVIIDTGVIKNLPKDIFSDGFGEVIKYAVLDKKIYNEIKKENYDLTKVIALSVSYKNKIVSQDEFEKNQRKFLNLGHTYAHAIEKLSDYKISHGTAVIMGTKKILDYALRERFIDEENYQKLSKIISKIELPNDDFDIEEIISVIKNDKKRKGDAIDLVVPTKIGKVKIIKTPIEDLRSVYGNCDNK